MMHNFTVHMKYRYDTG